MKFKTTRKAIMANYSTVICLGYCDLQHMLSAYGDPIAYTSGVYGWNADIYTVRGVAICTGYRPFGTVSPNHQTVEEFRRREKEICDMYSDWTKSAERREALCALLEEFVERMTR